MSNTTNVPLTVLQARTASEVGSYRRFEERAPGGRLDLAELVNSQLRHPVRAPNQRTVSTFHEMSEAARQRSGQNPDGLFVPLTVFARDLTTSNSPTLVSGTVANNGFNALLPMSGIMAAGATTISGLKGSAYAIPSIDTTVDASSGWVSENGAAPQLEPTFRSQTITPYSLAVQLVISRALLTNSSVDVDTLLRKELANRLSIAIDRAAIQGSGVNQPLGLLSTSGVQVLSAGTNGLAPTHQHMVELEYNVMGRTAGEAGAPSYLTSAALARKLRTTARVAGQDRFIYEGRDILGYPVRSSTNVPDNLTKGTSVGNCSAMIFGDFAEVVVGWWGPAAVDFLVDSHTLANRGAVRIVARADVGVALRRPEAFAIYKDLLSA